VSFIEQYLRGVSPQYARQQNRYQEGLKQKAEQSERQALMSKLYGREQDLAGNRSGVSGPRPENLGSGLLGSKMGPKDFMRFNQGLGGSSSPMLQKQWMDNNKQMQNNMSGSGSPKYMTMGVPGQPGMRVNAVVGQDGVPMPIGEPWKQGSGVNVNVNGQKSYIKPGTVLEDSKGNKVPVPVGMTEDEARAKGLMYGKALSDSAVNQQAAMGASNRMVGELTDLQDEGVDISGVKGFLEDARTGADAIGVATNIIMNYLDMPQTTKKARAVSTSKALSNQLLQAMRGAAVGPAEQAMFEKQLPVAGQPTKTYEQNLLLTARNLKYIRDKTKEISKGVKAEVYNDTDGPMEGFTWSD